MRRWVRQADIDAALVDGQAITEASEVVALERKMRRLEMEDEILRRAGPGRGEVASQA